MGRAKFLRLRLGRVLLWLALAVVIATVAITFADQSARLKELQKEQEELETVREELALEKARLEHMIDYAQTDEYVEQMAREVFGWVKKDEIKYLNPDQTGE